MLKREDKSLSVGKTKFGACEGMTVALRNWSPPLSSHLIYFF